MNRPSTQATVLRALLASALLVALCGCTGGNIGSLSDPSPPGTGGGGGGGGGLGRGPAVAPGDGALSLEGRPRNLAFAPRAGSTGVDVHAPLALWFNESVNLATVNALSVQLRPKGGVGSVAYGVRGYCGDRLVVLTPTANLQTDTVYQVYLSDQLTDLSGQRVRLPNTEGLLGGFRTAAQSSGVAPRVLATFPPDGASSEPNDHAFVIVFSKRIDFTSVSGAVDLQADGLAAAYGLPVGHSNDRVIEFAHLDDELDLGAAMTVEISTDITDTEFVPQNLAEAYSAAWTTFGLARPSGIDIGAEAAANLGNLDAFPTNVAVGASALVTDVAHLEVWEGLGSDQVSGDQPAVNGPGSVAFVSDLSDGNGAPVLADGLLTIGAFLQRGALRTTFRVQQSFFQDTVRPVLVEFGPPAASIPSRFSTDLPEFRPYGLASEPISAVEVEFAPNPASTRTTLLPSPDKFFLGDAFPLPQVSGGPFAFTARLTDAAGNQMVDPVAGSAVFRGFTGPAPAAGTVSVLAFNARGLRPVGGATVYIEDSGGTPNEDSASTGSGGSVVFNDSLLPGARAGAQTVTIVHPSYHTVTVAGIDSSVLSVPLRERVPPARTVAPAVGGVAGGTGRFVSPLLTLDSATLDPDSMRDIALPLGFSSVGVLPDRPGWFAAFHDVEAYGGDPVTGRYFDLFAIDPRVLVDATDGSGGPTVAPLLQMVPSSFAGVSSSDWIFPLTLTTGANFNTPTVEKSVSNLSVIPGMTGVAVTGTGAISFTNAATELEQALHTLAVGEGADLATTRVQIWAQDSDGDEALRRVEVLAVAAPGLTPVVLPDISLPLGPTGAQTWPNVALSFSHSLAGNGDWYRLILVDNDLVENEWEVWLPAASTAGSFDLPSLKPNPSSPSDDPPLLTDPGNMWTLQVETFELPPAFTPSGIFFRQLRRDNLGWTLSVPGTAFSVLLP